MAPGVIYRIDTKAAGAKPFAVYAAGRKEITSLAMDPAGECVRCRGRDEGTGGVLPPLPVTGNVGVTITFSQPGSATAAGANTLVPDGSEIYRIGADGAPSKLLTLKDDVVYGLTFRNGSLLAANGKPGAGLSGGYECAGDGLPTSRTWRLRRRWRLRQLRVGCWWGRAIAGRCSGWAMRQQRTRRIRARCSMRRGFSQWGRMETRPEIPQGVELYVRSGNVPTALMGWSDWTRVGADGTVTAPAARFVQWKAVLGAKIGTSAGLERVGLNYLPKNAAPVVDDVVVQTGARMPSSASVPQSSTVQIAFPPAAGAAQPLVFSTDAGPTPLTAQKDKTAITARWLAHDENGDDLMFAVWYRGSGETNWRLLKDKINDRFYSFDSALLPDGAYELKVVASDAPVHTDADTLSGEKVSAEFVVDTTPPVPGTLAAELVPGAPARIHVRVEARDATSPISHAEYSVDAGPWQYVEPVGKVSDSLSERYDFMAAIPNVTTLVTDTKEHVIAVRVYDRFENAATVKAVVR